MKLFLALMLLSQPQAKPAQLHLDVFTSSPNGFSVTSTLIYGDKELIVIDPQFLLSEAKQLANKIRSTSHDLRAGLRESSGAP